MDDYEKALLMNDLSELSKEIERAAAAIGRMLERWDNPTSRPRAARVYYENLLSSLVGLLSALNEAIDAERET